MVINLLAKNLKKVDLTLSKDQSYVEPEGDRNPGMDPLYKKKATLSIVEMFNWLRD